MYYFLVNPASKSGHGKKLWNPLEDYLKANKIEYKVYFSKRPGHMEELMYDICSEHLNDDVPANVVVLGGDGSFNEAIQGVISFDKVRIGHIPSGSGNDFSRAFDYSVEPLDNLKRILACEKPMKLDVGTLKLEHMSSERSSAAKDTVRPTRYFNISCGIGFDAAVCEEVLTSKFKGILNRLGLGKLVYGVIAVKQIFGAKLCDALLTMDGNQIVQVKNCRLIVGMNTCYEGGGLKFVPTAVSTDGYIDICTVGNLHPFKVLMVLPGSAKGRHLKQKEIKTYHVKSYEIKTKEPLWVHTDGEVFVKADHIKVGLIPGGLNFLW